MFESTPSAQAIPPAVRVDLYSHNVKLSEYDDRLKTYLLQYCRGLVSMGLKRVGPGKFIQVPKATYAASLADRTEFRFHIHQWEDLKVHLSRFGITDGRMNVVNHPMYVPVKVSFDKVTKQEPRDYQIPLIEYLCAPGKTKLLTLQTGKGKTFTTNKAVSLIGVRVGLVIKGGYVEKWVGDVHQDLGLKPGEVMVVRGSTDMKKIIELANHKQLKAQFIIITNKTLANFYRSYEREYGTSLYEYGCKPGDLWELLGVGLRIIDEVHQEYHSNFRVDLYSNVPKTISLSGSLEADDSFMNRMYDVAFPKDCRPPETQLDRYVVVRALQYRIKDPNRIRCTGANKMYSHVKFEQSVMKHRDILANYLEMITDITYNEFVKDFDPAGMRMLIFAATVEFCTLLRNHLHKKFPDLNIARYVSEDEFSVLSNNDIIVTTLKSAGTALDISGLWVCFMTDSIDSKQANIQAVGRLRRLKQWPDVTPKFVYIYATNNDKHVSYHYRKMDKLRTRVLGYADLITNYHI